MTRHRPARYRHDVYGRILLATTEIVGGLVVYLSPFHDTDQP